MIGGELETLLDGIVHFRQCHAVDLERHISIVDLVEAETEDERAVYSLR